MPRDGEDAEPAKRSSGRVRKRRWDSEGDSAASASAVPAKRTRFDGSGKPPVVTAAVAATTVDEKERKLADMREQIAGRLKALAAKTSAIAKPVGAATTPVVSVGATTPATPPAPVDAAPVTPKESVEELPGAHRRRRPGFNWVREGRFVKRGERMRSRQHLQRLLSLSIPFETSKSEDLDLDIALMPAGAERKANVADPGAQNTAVVVPEVEWWDVAILGENSYAALCMTEEELADARAASTVLAPRAAAGSGSPGPHPFRASVPELTQGDLVTSLEQHPATLAPSAGCKVADPNMVLPMMLTNEERRKLRKQRRREALKEKQDKMRLGIIDPEQPKMTEKSFVRVLGSQALLNPTEAESAMRAQVAERAEKHEAHQLENKRTVEEQKAKILEKLRVDRMKGLYAAVYRVGHIDHPLHRRKVDLTAQQLALTGVVLIAPGMVLVVAEGGLKALRKFNGLLMRRIDWNQQLEQPDDPDAESDGDGPAEVADAPMDTGAVEPPARLNECVEVWKGLVGRAQFKNFRFEAVNSSERARAFLRSHSAEVYWNAAHPVDAGADAAVILPPLPSAQPT